MMSLSVICMVHVLSIHTDTHTFRKCLPYFTANWVQLGHQFIKWNYTWMLNSFLCGPVNIYCPPCCSSFTHMLISYMVLCIVDWRHYDIYARCSTDVDFSVLYISHFSVSLSSQHFRKNVHNHSLIHFENNYSMPLHFPVCIH